MLTKTVERLNFHLFPFSLSSPASVTSSIFIEGFFLDEQVVLANSTDQLVVAAVAYATSINYIHMGTSLQLLKGVFKEGWLAVRRPDENKMEQRLL